MDRTPFIAANLKALAARQPDTARWLGEHPRSLELCAERLFMHRPGLVDWRMDNGRGLFEGHSPLPFYAGWIRNEDKADAQRHARSATVLIGCNLGYGLNHLLENTPRTHPVLLIEPRPEMLLAAFASTDYGPFLDCGKLQILPPVKEVAERTLQQLDVQFLFGKIDLKLDVPSQQMGPEYTQWLRLIQGVLENLSVDLATMRHRQDVMVGNELANYSRAARRGSVTPLRDAAKGLTALLLGAGPSLERFASNIKTLSGDCLIVTAMQTLPVLQRLGVTPHLCMAIDYSEGMRRLYDRLDPAFAASIPLLYSTKLDPEVLSRYPGPTIPVWTRGGLGTFVFAEHEHILDAGGNVSVALYRLLRWFGIARVALAGQDYAWRDGKSHAEGHHANAPGSATIVNASGETLQSSLQYITAARDLANDIQQYGLPTVNLYGDGIVIQGARHVDAHALRQEGLLTSEPGSLAGFLAALREAEGPRPIPRFEPRSDMWSSSLRAAGKRLERLFKHPAREQAAIAETIARLLQFVRQDPLYMPYLYNEIMDLTGMFHLGRAWEGRDLAALKRILKRTATKVREMDRVLCLDSAPPARGPASSPVRQAA